MDAVLRNFKMIPCPSGDSCTKPNCQWQHSWDKNAPTTTASAIEATRDEEDGPRKRRKLSAERESAPRKSEPPMENYKVPSEPASAQRPVSPPPLKKRKPTLSGEESPAVPALPKPPPAKSITGTPSSKPDNKVMPPTSTPQKATPQKPAPRKPEALNPRHLKSAAPAPHDFRYKALKLLHDQFQRLNSELKKDAKEDENKLVLSAQELIWLALDEEQKMATDKPAIYQNIIKNKIMMYKRMTPGQWRDERLAEAKKKAARTVALSTPKSVAGQATLGPPKVINTGLTPQQEVEFLQYLLTPISGLSQWNYVSVPPTEEEIAKAREGEEAGLGWEACDRCKTRFQVFPGRREEDGALASGGQCVHHPGRTYFPERAPGSTDKQARRYRCCQQAVGDSPGCAIGQTHVWKTSSPARMATVLPFVETPPNPDVPKDRAVCFDCEMGYTVRGFELLRLTATSWPDGKELLDVLVQPVGEILDLNSRYSGVWPEDIANAERWSGEFSISTDNADGTTTTPTPTTTTTTTTQPSNPEESPPIPKKKPLKIVPSPSHARTLLFSLISPSTPLIGHGLENDLNAVRIVHPTLIDTILLYPHPKGLPIRYGLKKLMEEKLNKAVQIESGKGHDSGEDARAAGELVRLKVEERWKGMKAEGWVWEDKMGFVNPGDGEGKEEGEGKGEVKKEGERKKEGLLSEGFLEDGEVGEIADE